MDSDVSTSREAEVSAIWTGNHRRIVRIGADTRTGLWKSICTHQTRAEDEEREPYWLHRKKCAE